VGLGEVLTDAGAQAAAVRRIVASPTRPTLWPPLVFTRYATSARASRNIGGSPTRGIVENT
jgi:hypothetical protein